MSVPPPHAEVLLLPCWCFPGRFVAVFVALLDDFPKGGGDYDQLLTGLVELAGGRWR